MLQHGLRFLAEEDQHRLFPFQLGILEECGAKTKLFAQVAGYLPHGARPQLQNKSLGAEVLQEERAEF